MTVGLLPFFMAVINISMKGIQELITNNSAPLKGCADAWMEVKEKAIVQALLQTNGNYVRAARLLGISRNQLYVYRKKMGLK